MSKKTLIKISHALNSVPWFKYHVVIPIYNLKNDLFVYKKFMSDEKYIEYKYKKKFGVMPSLQNPKNFNEKNNWRKLHDRKDIYTQMVDKLRMKNYVAERIGEGHCAKTYKVFEKPSEINLDELPDKFVLKCNHDGGVNICLDKKSFDLKRAKAELGLRLKTNYFVKSREWPYKNVKRCIFCEEYLGKDLIDYKIYCFNGVPKYVFVWRNVAREDGRKPSAHFCGAYDMNWVKDERIKIKYPMMDIDIPKPDCFEEMKDIATKISAGTIFVRTDCYIIKDHIYVGECTFFPWGGFMQFESEEVNLLLGEMEKISQ